ncbi:MAG: HEPN domain-containing protein [Breznakibacter sp.]
MKTSVKYLPRERQEDLKYLTGLILKRIPQTEMVILYGSYATGKYVEYDSRVEFGIRTTYMSDYDILVVTSGAKDKEVGQKLDNIEEIYYKNPDKQTPVQFINDDIGKLNKDLSDGRYFYTQVKQEGVFLYNSGKFKLERCRKLRYDEIKQQAEGYFEEKYNRAISFFKHAQYASTDEDYRMASFFLHQTCENLFYAVRLVYTLENSKQHNLAKLLDSVRKYSGEFEKIFFPRKTEDEKRLFNLVKAAYVEARYNPGFVVTKTDMELLMQAVEQLFDLVKEVCGKRIAEFEKSV